MIRAIIEQTFDQQKKYVILAGLSTDSKPTAGIITGSKFEEVNTGIVYAFDEVSGTWSAVGLSPAEIKAEIDAWLDDHPEATTTVEDGAITYAKLNSSLQGTVDEVGVLSNVVSDLQNATTANTESISDLQKGKAPVIIDTASGEIASFPDGADSLPLSVRFDIDPVQDLHGQDAPYPPGGGKNLLDPEKRITYGSGYGLRWYYDDGFVLKANQAYTFSVTFSNPIALYIINKATGDTIANGSDNLTVTPTEDTTVYMQAYRAQDISSVDTFQLELGSTATAYVPYSNICPITGWTGANVVRCGGTQHPIADKNMDNAGVTGQVSDGDLDLTGTTTSAYDKYVDSEAIAPGTYTLSGFQDLTSMGQDNVWYIYNSTAGTRIYSGQNPNGETVIIPSTGTHRLGILLKSGVVVDIHCHPFMTSEYTARQITWQSHGTIYGGYVVVGDDGSVKVVATHAVADIGNSSYIAVDPNRPGVFYFGETDRKSSSNIVACSEYECYNETVTTDKDFYISGNPSYGGGILFIRDTRYASASAAEYKTAATGIKYVYELATPIEYDLSDITPITSLLGDNNVFADTGDVAVDYRADTKLYVDNQIADKISASQRLMELIVTANREDGMKATTAYSTGNLLIVNGTLYKATTSIANGATLTVGTNVTATTVANELALLA